MNAARAACTGVYRDFLAGGMSLLPSLKLRLAAPSDLVDLGAITALKGYKEAELARIELVKLP